MLIMDYIMDAKLDICGITETWLSADGDKHKNVIGDLSPDGYSIIHIPRLTAGGGVAVIHKDNIRCERHYSFKAMSFESIITDFNMGHARLKLAIIYRPPPSAANKSTKAQFFKEFPEFLGTLVTSGMSLLIAGDFNFHMELTAERDAIKLRDILDSANLHQHVNEATHLSGHMLDLVISRSEENIVSSVRVANYISDHAALLCNLKLVKPEQRKVEVVYRKTKSIDHEAFAADIAASPLLQSPPSGIEDSVDQYNQVLASLLDKHAPIKKRLMRKFPKSPWYNMEVIQAKKICRRAERKWRQTKLTADRVSFQMSRTRWVMALKQAKSEYYKALITENDDPKKLFSTIEGLLHQKGKEVVPTRDSTEELVHDFNTFFVSKIAKIQADLGGEQYTVQGEGSSTLLEVFTPATNEEVIKTVLSSPCKTSPQDPIPAWLLKQHVNTLAPALTRIINLSLGSGVFPDSMKTASVRPLIKKSTLNSEELKNYRPVSNLSYLSKLLERIVASRLSSHMVANNLYEPTQAAYREHHGTETVVVRVTNDVLRALDEKKGVYLVLLDLSAAFDTIHHHTLLHRLQENIGLRGTTLQWISSYLTHRKQYVSISGVKSESVDLLFGVPQGSVLGPKLFTIYAGPIADICRRHSLRAFLYADDSQLYLFFELSTPGDQDKTKSQIEECIVSIRKWMKANYLKLNDEKTELMIFVPPNHKEKLQSTSILVGESAVQASATVRDLGIHLDPALNMEHHVRSICKAAYNQLHMISSIRKCLDSKTTEKLVHAFVTSRLDCGNAVLAGLPQKLLSKLQTVQNSAARLVLRLRKWDHISPALRQLHWLPVKQRIEYKVLLLTWKALNNQAPSFIMELLELHIPNRQLRSGDAKCLTIPRTKTVTYGERALSVLAPKLWNKLPKSLRNCTELNTYKCQLKTHLYSSAYEMLA